MIRISSIFTLTILLFSYVNNIFWPTANATSVYPRMFKLDVIDRGLRLDGGTPDAISFPRTIPVYHYDCSDGKLPTYDELRGKSAIFLVDISLDGALEKAEILEPESDIIVQQTVNALVRCWSLEKAFAERGVYGWKNIKVQFSRS